MIEECLRGALHLVQPSGVSLDLLARLGLQAMHLPVQARDRLVGDALDHLPSHGRVDLRGDQDGEGLRVQDEIGQTLRLSKDSHERHPREVCLVLKVGEDVRQETRRRGGIVVLVDSLVRRDASSAVLKFDHTDTHL